MGFSRQKSARKRKSAIFFWPRNFPRDLSPGLPDGIRFSSQKFKFGQFWSCNGSVGIHILWTFGLFYGLDTWSISWTFGLFYSHLVYFLTFGKFCGNLVYFPRCGMLYQEKSGNPVFRV
jgi:hypothetical protein